ncbi:hypothetical protein Y1Q_0000985 [Alligator mississippiensis]|uniref:Uncharacterized protein n=1 Tax=Alligator mississippiensis TaxID=8496 RepID=A0A151NE87_ALLMI|nr:hypothetical protein Y1Q_0000985 [Alligator mississippiensis]
MRRGKGGTYFGSTSCRTLFSTAVRDSFSVLHCYFYERSTRPELGRFAPYTSKVLFENFVLCILLQVKPQIHENRISVLTP